MNNKNKNMQKASLKLFLLSSIVAGMTPNPALIFDPPINLPNPEPKVDDPVIKAARAARKKTERDRRKKNNDNRIHALAILKERRKKMR